MGRLGKTETLPNESRNLFISFWHIGLENIPEGTFTHRCLPPSEAKHLIEQARHAEALRGASHDDIFAPHHQHELENHEKLRRVLHDHYGIGLTLDDFSDTEEENGEQSQFVWPLVLARLGASNRILVVNCNYVLAPKREPHSLIFDVAPESVTFHLFESV
jgi:hypothetical protein